MYINHSKIRLWILSYQRKIIANLGKRVRAVTNAVSIFDKDFQFFDVLPARGVFDGILPHDPSIAQTVGKIPHYKSTTFSFIIISPF